ncbi:MAG: hypothetical protein PQJ58_02600 [Spirochaetales bacterium]|nr:hypothetical protein [Spirochaetales bacterium]
MLTASLILISAFSAAAQTVQPSQDYDFLEQEYQKDTLKALALEEIAEGNYNLALNHLNAALALDPDDRELADLRQSVEDLLLLEEQGEIGETNPEIPDFTEFTRPEEEIITPDFAQEMLSDSQRQNPAVMRNAFSFELGGAYGMTEPVYLSGVEVLKTEEEFLTNPFYRISAESQFFLVENERNIGIGLRYKDIAYNPDNVDMMERMFDITMHYRGFFAETMESRLILGIKAGAGFLGIKEDLDEDDVADSDTVNTTIFLAGLYFSDALFRYLMPESTFFKRFIIEMNFDFIFVRSLEDISLSQYSISGGYHFPEHWTFSIYSEAFNTSTSIQNTSSIEVGGRIKYSY